MPKSTQVALVLATPAQVRTTLGDMSTSALVNAKAAELGMSERNLYRYLKHGVVIKIGLNAATMLHVIEEAKGKE